MTWRDTAVFNHPVCTRKACHHSALSHRHLDGQQHAGACVREGCSCQRFQADAAAVVDAAAREEEPQEAAAATEPTKPSRSRKKTATTTTV